MAGLPIIDSADLATYLNDSRIDTARANAMIGDAQALCETVVFPLPAAASVVVKRVAGRAYVSVTSPRQAQLADAGSPFGGTPGGMGGVYLTQSDRRDLRSAAGGGGAFSIDVLPSAYATALPWWDTSAGSAVYGDWDTPV